MRRYNWHKQCTNVLLVFWSQCMCLLAAEQCTSASLFIQMDDCALYCPVDCKHVHDIIHKNCQLSTVNTVYLSLYTLFKAALWDSELSNRNRARMIGSLACSDNTGQLPGSLAAQRRLCNEKGGKFCIWQVWVSAAWLYSTSGPGQ